MVHSEVAIIVISLELMHRTKIYIPELKVSIFTGFHRDDSLPFSQKVLVRIRQQAPFNSLSNLHRHVLLVNLSSFLSSFVRLYFD